MLNTILLAILVALTLLVAAEGAVLVVAVRWKDLEWRRKEKLDAEVEEATRRESRMDEGFENLMRFSVGGKDGFGVAEDE